MSWDSYIDNLVGQGQGSVDKACIIGLDGGAAWTTAGHAKAFKLAPNESSSIAQCFKSKQFDAFMTNGIYAEGTKYQFLRATDDKVVLGKKKDLGSICMQSTKTAIVIAHCPEGGQQGLTNKAVGVIADYLESLNM